MNASSLKGNSFSLGDIGNTLWGQIIAITNYTCPSPKHCHISSPAAPPHSGVPKTFSMCLPAPQRTRCHTWSEGLQCDICFVVETGNTVHLTQWLL